MKARVKATGKIVEVNRPYNTPFGNDIYFDAKENNYPYLLDELDFDFVNDPDYWDKLLHQYAGMAMQGLLNNSLLAGELKKDPNNGIAEMSNTITKAAVIYATALVEKLKNE